ncbi:MerC domain-containing protein [Erythrobacter sp. W53]|uniref:MerC domain-containing protein n=1 Tax=Erythrobacter sp. W53 TaxID=3425947 RepID=UPI003D769D67
MKNAPSTSIQNRFDHAGIAVSGLCALHCLASIMLVPTLGIGGQFFFASEFHGVALVLAIVIAAITIGWGAFKHRLAAPIVIALTGLCFMVGALLVPHGSKEVALTLIGVGLVTLGHVLNLRTRKPASASTSI